MFKTIEEVAARAAEVADELEALAASEELTEADETRYDELVEEANTLVEARATIEARDAARAAVRAAAEVPEATEGGVNFRTVNNRDEEPVTARSLAFSRLDEVRSRAVRAIEELDTPTVDDSAKEELVRKMSTVKDARGIIPSLTLLTTTDAYRSAFAKGLAGRQDVWTSEERAAVAEVEEYRAALSLTDANGGYAVPVHLDPTLILTNDGAISPIRQLARVETITGDNWNGLSSAGVTASWDGEITEVSDDSPTFAQPSVTPHKAQAFVQGSIEITQDYRGLEGDIVMMLADGKNRLEAAAFINGAGNGSNQPFGIITALDGGSSEVSPATAEAFAVADVYATSEALPARWRGNNPAFVAELSTINAMRQFATANNYHAFLTDMTASSPRQLLGYRLFEDSSMDAYSAVNTAATADNHLLLFGDFSQYLIVDRIGMSVEFIPHLFNTTTNLPDGRRGWYAHWRVGADSLVDGAFRVLNVATTA